MELRVPYFDLGKQTVEATFGAIVEILLRSRLKMQLETNKGFYEEDVNTYLAGVLFEYIDPGYQQAVRQYLSERDTDVFLSATRDDDSYQCYWVYKINADDRLLDLGIFHAYRSTQETLLDQAKTYYGFASSYNHRLYGRATAISDILEKLSRWTERYVSILNRARRDYFHFVELTTAEQLHEFHEGVLHDARQWPLKAKQDEFLDTYSQWSKTPTPDLQIRLIQLAGELRQMDPLFRAPSFQKPSE